MKLTKQFLVVLLLSFLALAYSKRHDKYVTENLAYVPDRAGNFYWHDLNEVTKDPLFDAEKDVAFILFTKRTPSGELVKYKSLKSLDNSEFNKTRPTRFLIHGWMGEMSWVYDAVKFYREAGDYNLFLVDWSAVATNWLYPVAVKHTEDIGVTIAGQINFWYDNGRFNSYDDIIITGIGMAAHIAGIAGKNTAEKVKVIYGLDPAGPLFTSKPSNRRLDEDDAQLTVALRTNTGPLGYGYNGPLAHMEFLPNGGVTQPGCLSYLSVACSHFRSFHIFKEAIKSDRFDAAGCETFGEIKKDVCSQTGTFEKFRAEGINNNPGFYYFVTAAQSPYALGKDGLPQPH